MFGRKTEVVIVNHTMSNTHTAQTCLMGQVCFNFFINDSI